MQKRSDGWIISLRTFEETTRYTRLLKSWPGYKDFLEKFAKDPYAYKLSDEQFQLLGVRDVKKVMFMAGEPHPVATRVSALKKL